MKLDIIILSIAVAISDAKRTEHLRVLQTNVFGESSDSTSSSSSSSSDVDDTQGCPCNTAGSLFRDFVDQVTLYDPQQDSCLLGITAQEGVPEKGSALGIYKQSGGESDFKAGTGTGFGGGFHDCTGDFSNPTCTPSCRSGGPYSDDLSYQVGLTQAEAVACYNLLYSALVTSGYDGECDTVNVPYSRVWRKLYSNGKDIELFDLMEGDERRHHLSAYEDKKFTTSSLGICDYAASKFYGRTVTHEKCFQEVNEVPAKAVARDLQSYEPWVVPSSKEAVLIAPNPGIWSIENFLDEEEMVRLERLVHKYGHNLGLFGPCKHDKRHPANAHPMEGKLCFKMSVEHVCDGPYDVSACDVPPDTEDSDFIEGILSRFQSLWPTQPKAAPYAKFQVASGGTPPVDLHADTEKIVSFVLYFSNGGASMIFPDANVTVTPKRGTAHTWLNTFKDQRTRNPVSDHAVQAHPASAGERLVMLFEIPTLPFRTEL